MSTGNRVLVGFDGTLGSEAALRWALDDAARRGVGVTILHAEYPDASVSHRSLEHHAGPDDGYDDYARATLDRAVRLSKDWAPEVPVTAQLVGGTAAGALLEAAQHAAVVVTGTRAINTFSELMTGSTSFAVATHAPVPVVVVRQLTPPGVGPEAGRVVVGIDGSEPSIDALAFALDEAHLRGVGLTAVRTWQAAFFDTPGGKGGAIPSHVADDMFAGQEAEALRESVEPWLLKFPDVDVRQRIVHAGASEALTDLGAGAQLLVVGSRGRGGFTSLLLGSVSHAVLHHATCPLAIVR
jgi:nucleotide-binding universal stress UspA family protein